MTHNGDSLDRRKQLWRSSALRDLKLETVIFVETLTINTVPYFISVFRRAFCNGHFHIQFMVLGVMVWGNCQHIALIKLTSTKNLPVKGLRVNLSSSCNNRVDRFCLTLHVQLYITFCISIFNRDSQQSRKTRLQGELAGSSPLLVLSTVYKKPVLIIMNDHTQPNELPHKLFRHDSQIETGHKWIPCQGQ